MVFWAGYIVEERAKKFDKVNSLTEAVMLAESQGLSVDWWDLAEVQGMLVQLPGGRPHICVNERLSEPEQAQVVLHELGHFLLHWNHFFRPIMLGHKHQVAREDREADHFAWCLMSDTLREAYLQAKEGWECP